MATLLQPVSLNFFFPNSEYHSNGSTLYIPQITANFKYCSHVYGSAAPMTRHLLNAVEKNANRTTVTHPFLQNIFILLLVEQSVIFCFSTAIAMFSSLIHSFANSGSSTCVFLMHPFRAQLHMHRTSEFYCSHIDEFIESADFFLPYSSVV